MGELGDEFENVVIGVFVMVDVYEVVELWVWVKVFVFMDEVVVVVV